MKTILAVLSALAILGMANTTKAQAPAIVPECMPAPKFPDFLKNSGEEIVAVGRSFRHLKSTGEDFQNELFITVNPDDKQWTVFELLRDQMCALAYGTNFRSFVDLKKYY
jgi:hypothetical protein